MVHHDTSLLKFIVIIALGYGVAPALAVPVDREENPAQNPPPSARQPNPEDLAAYFRARLPNTHVYGNGFVSVPTGSSPERSTARPVFAGSSSRPSSSRPSSSRPPRHLSHVQGSFNPTQHAVMQNNRPDRIQTPVPWDDPIALQSWLDNLTTEDFAVHPQGDVPANNRPPPARTDDRGKGPMYPPHFPPHRPP